jgi:tetratricopeptide (TPR) repeat protein
MRELFQKAVQLHRQGNLVQAEAMYRTILRQMPKEAEVLNAIGMLLQQRGAANEAIASFRKALKSRPESEHISLNLAEAQRRSGLHVEARKTLDALLKRRPQMGEAWFCMGSLLHDQGQLEKAVECYRKTIKLAPSFLSARNSLGVALQEIGRLDEGIDELKEAIRLQPQSAEAHLNLANTYLRKRLKRLAEQHYRSCLAIAPGLPQAHLGLAQLGLEEGTVSDLTDEALAFHLQAAQTLASTPEYLYAAGMFEARKGKWDVAEGLLRQSLELRPDANTLYQYVHGKKFERPEPGIERMLAALLENSEPRNVEAQALLQFSQGKMLNDLKRFEEAFAAYEEGNRLINATRTYDPAAVEAKIDRLIETFDSALLANWLDPSPSNTEKLVFVVGMPRSGTTLTEQILAAHPQVAGAGELPGLALLEIRLPEMLDASLPYPELVPNLDLPATQRIAESYLMDLDRQFPGAHQRLVDKSPVNFWHIGLIGVLFPRSKIIHVRRDPLDCCLSNYFQMFAEGQDFAFDLANLGHYYRCYERLMAHWKTVLPEMIMDVRYEELTADPEFWTRELVRFIGLEWSEACLNPHESQGSVKTASIWQVRQPIYKTSVQRWKHYEAHLEPLKLALGMRT